ncbi:uncharacterized protein LOC143029529 [Oratosquilla oratoria]|uniref:uncharacterized protein LOC143029529 n=1 Tax=Oratosquilla oratoria TaxID=337810 RepID=UPI003F7763DC
MPRNVRLTATEKQRIVAGLAEGLTLLDLAKELGRDKRTLASFVEKPSTTPRKDKGTRRSISPRDMRKIRRQVNREPNGTSASIFAKAGVDPMSRKTRCSVLNEMARNVKPISRPPLDRTHKEKRVKLTSQAYISFLDEHLSPWLYDLPLLRRRQLIFMHDNAPSHAAKATTSFLASLGIKGETLMTWPPCSPDLNPIEQLWSILKREVYEGGQQFTSKDALWNKIVAVASTIKPSQIKRLTSSVDSRLLRVISRNGSYVDK